MFATSVGARDLDGDDDDSYVQSGSSSTLLGHSIT